jgi:polyisoprenyl-phosphate glycosyltransferase
LGDIVLSAALTKTRAAMPAVYSLVIPIYNEEAVLPVLLRRLDALLDALDAPAEAIFIDDGSRDAGPIILEAKARADRRYRFVKLSRNFGHQVAITTGMEHAVGRAVVVMDADLQDPPELLRQMVGLYRQGFDVVSAQRVGREGEGPLKRGTAALFYGLMRRAVDERLQSQVGDFRLFSRGAVLALRRFREQHRFMRGLVAWLGLKEAVIPFHRPARVAGTTKYPLWKMMRFAWTAISSFSALPLKISLVVGLLLTAFGVVYSAWAIYEKVVLHTTEPGWSSLVCLQLLFSGATLTAVGLMGDYVARIYEEVKGRPLYVLSEVVNLGPDAPTPVRAIYVAPLVTPEMEILSQKLPHDGMPRQESIARAVDRAATPPEGTAR